MKTLSQHVLEAIGLDDYRNFLKEFDLQNTGVEADKDRKRQADVEAYKSAFWNVLKSQPNAEISRNGHRIYFPFDQSVRLDANVAQIAQYFDGMLPIEKEVHDYVTTNLGGKDIENWDYKEGTFDVSIDTQMGKKLRAYKIGKFIAKNRELLDAFAADPIRLTKNIENEKKLIVISDHAYDIAGMSTGRKWTSCMNILNGCNREYVATDIKYGTLVAYMILADDKNIEAPLGRVLIKPYELTRQGYTGFAKRPVVYSPDPTVYSTYVGLDGMVKFLDDLCKETQPYSGKLKRKDAVYYDTFFKKKDLDFNL